MKGSHFDGLPFRLCLFFAANPDEYVTGEDIAAKFGCHRSGITRTLRHVLRAGLIDMERAECWNHASTFRAGAALRRLIGTQQ